MTHSEALALADDLEALKLLRKNSFWLNHVLPEIRRLREEHRSGMRDRTKDQASRCEDATAWESMQGLEEFADREEKKIRATLQEHDRAHPGAERPFSHAPL